ncbi:MAG: GNAT family N-acetyltransferase [Actinobacteria bacterium]|nr:GNAT family N-acetyltransferase [Actinomycetota bacterium]
MRTDRLVLRRFRDADRGPFAELNADPRVMEHFVRPLTRAESDDFVDRIEERFRKQGYSLWAVEVRGSDPFIGYVGLWDATFEAPFTPTVEVGWRLAARAWGHGYATEAAEAAVDDGLVRVGVRDIVSFTAAANLRSRAVMERIGMVRDPDGDFLHPAVPEDHPVRPHVLYRFPDLELRRREAAGEVA